MNCRQLKITLVGCGNHAVKYHAPALRRCADESPAEICLAAACDLDAGRAEHTAQEFGFAESCTDMHTLLKTGGIDGTVCVMPLQAISGIGVRMLERGMPCVIEKPLGASVEDVHNLEAAALSSGTPHMVSVNRRFNPGLTAAIAWARAQGEIVNVRAAMLRERRREPDFLWGTGLHLIDAVAHIGGGIRNCTFRAQQGKNLSSAWYHAELILQNDAAASIDINPTCGQEDERYEIAGENFRVTITMHSKHGTEVRGFRHGEPVLVQDYLNSAMPRWEADGTYHETRAFISALNGTGPFFPRIQDVAPTVRICHEACVPANR